MNILSLIKTGTDGIKAALSNDEEGLKKVVDNFIATRKDKIPDAKKLSRPMAVVGGTAAGIYTAVVQHTVTTEIPILFGLFSKTVTVVQAASAGTYIWNIAIGSAGGWSIGALLDKIMDVVDSRSERKMAILHEHRMKEIDRLPFSQKTYGHKDYNQSPVV